MNKIKEQIFKEMFPEGFNEYDGAKKRIKDSINIAIDLTLTEVGKIIDDIRDKGYSGDGLLLLKRKIKEGQKKGGLDE